MKIRRLLFAVIASLLATSSLAQFEQEQKDQVLSEIGRVLSYHAFVPGVDLSKWESFIEGRKDKIASAESTGEFAMVVNSALNEFGLSHIQLMRSRRRGGDDLSAWQVSRFTQPAASLRWADDDSAILRVPSFDRGYDEAEIADFFKEASKAKYMVIDLRGNPGGEVEKMRQFLGLVLPVTTPVGTFVSRSIATDYAKAEKSATPDPVKIAAWARREFKPRRTEVGPFKGKVAVLVDGNSASASEIVANALREWQGSPIIGAPTAGAVLVSTFNRLSHGFQIQYPVGDYVSHRGVRLEGNPVKPDIAASGLRAVELAFSKLKG